RRRGGGDALRIRGRGGRGRGRSGSRGRGRCHACASTTLEDRLRRHAGRSRRSRGGRPRRRGGGHDRLRGRRSGAAGLPHLRGQQGGGTRGFGTGIGVAGRGVTGGGGG